MSNQTQRLENIWALALNHYKLSVAKPFSAKTILTVKNEKNS